jgi:pyruvate dehydrogenase E2 component (dihydrolipoamide acetyltransferase)/2-oxoglutarate dehydrogenase E2 component (dihydrolipoamide succinyltransferase)
MTTDIVIPKLGMTMEKATVSAWLAGEGDRVETGQPVLVIETEKVTYEVEALGSGLLHILQGPAYVAMVGEAVGRLAVDEAELAAIQQAEPGAVARAAPAVETTPVSVVPTSGASPEGDSGKVKISPLARKLAVEHNLDIRKISGTGPGGRIKVRDVEKYLEDLKAGPVLSAGAPEPAATAPGSVWSGGIIDGKRVKDRLALTGLRGAVAEHMLRSLAVSAQLTTMGEFDATELVRMRESLKAKADVLGARISYTDIIVYILARVLKRNPVINSSLVGSEIVLWEDVHIGVAVSMPWEQYDAGLIVPVIKNADQKSLVRISLEMKEMREKAAAGRLGLEDITGGTFTLSNVGSFGKGYMFSTPIINQPQAAILLTGGIVERPLVVNGQIVVRSVMNWSFTFDHRAINGAPVGKFIGEVGEYVGNPFILLA